jgi:hypothetical protein
VSALPLPAVGGTRGETSLGPTSVFVVRLDAERKGGTHVALAADHLVAVELGGEDLERRLDQTTTETEDQVESGLLYWIVSLRALVFAFGFAWRP